MRLGTHIGTKDVTLHLTEPEALRLANLLNQISNRPPDPRDDTSDALFRVLRDVLDVSPKKGTPN